MLFHLNKMYVSILVSLISVSSTATKNLNISTNQPHMAFDFSNQFRPNFPHTQIKNRSFFYETIIDFVKTNDKLPISDMDINSIKTGLNEVKNYLKIRSIDPQFDSLNLVFRSHGFLYAENTQEENLYNNTIFQYYVKTYKYENIKIFVEKINASLGDEKKYKYSPYKYESLMDFIKENDRFPSDENEISFINGGLAPINQYLSCERFYNPNYDSDGFKEYYSKKIIFNYLLQDDDNLNLALNNSFRYYSKGLTQEQLQFLINKISIKNNVEYFYNKYNLFKEEPDLGDLTKAFEYLSIQPSDRKIIDLENIGPDDEKNIAENKLKARYKEFRYPYTQVTRNRKTLTKLLKDNRDKTNQLADIDMNN